MVRVVNPSRLSAPAEPSQLAIAYLNTWRVYQPPPHPHLISSHSYYCRIPNLTPNSKTLPKMVSCFKTLSSVVESVVSQNRRWARLPTFTRSKTAVTYPFTLPNCLDTLCNYTFSLNITELNPVLIHYRTTPYLNTLPNCTLI